MLGTYCRGVCRLHHSHDQQTVGLRCCQPPTEPLGGCDELDARYSMCWRRRPASRRLLSPVQCDQYHAGFLPLHQIHTHTLCYHWNHQQTSFTNFGDWLTEHGLTSAPTQYRLYGWRFLHVFTSENWRSVLNETGEKRRALLQTDHYCSIGHGPTNVPSHTL